MSFWIISVALDMAMIVMIAYGLIRALRTGVANAFFIKTSRWDRPIGYWIVIMLTVLGIWWFASKLIHDYRTIVGVSN